MKEALWRGIGAVIALMLWAGAPVAAQPSSMQPLSASSVPTDISAQTRRDMRRRAPTRIEVRPLRRRLGPSAYRECVPVFEERWIPQWGGRVLYASQQCWWVQD